MSKLGKQPVVLPKGVEFKQTGKTVSVKGPKGQLELKIEKDIAIVADTNKVTLALGNSEEKSTQFLGLYRTLIYNMVLGVTEGFSKKLELKGVGFRAAVQGNDLNLQLGFSHPTKKPIPQGIEVKVENNVLVTISGVDKQLVGQYAAEIHHMRKPEPYKGKGVHYVGQYTRRKAGKSAAKK